MTAKKTLSVLADAVSSDRSLAYPALHSLNLAAEENKSITFRRKGNLK